MNWYGIENINTIDCLHWLLYKERAKENISLLPKWSATIRQGWRPCKDQQDI